MVNSIINQSNKKQLDLFIDRMSVEIKLTIMVNNQNIRWRNRNSTK